MSYRWVTNAKEFGKLALRVRRTASYLRLLNVDGIERKIWIMVLRAKTNRLQDLLRILPSCAQALLSIRSGQVVEVAMS